MHEIFRELFVPRKAAENARFMKFLLLSLAAILLLPFAATGSRAQMQELRDPREPYLSSEAAASETGAYFEQAGNTDVLTIHKRVQEVNVVFTAINGHGKFVRDLS